MLLNVLVVVLLLWLVSMFIRASRKEELVVYAVSFALAAFVAGACFLAASERVSLLAGQVLVKDERFIHYAVGFGLGVADAGFSLMTALKLRRQSKLA